MLRIFGNKLSALCVLFAVAFATAQSSLYLNFQDDGKGNAYISQSTEKCDSCSYSKLLDALTSTSEVLDSLLGKAWKPALLKDSSTYGTISFNSDIDFGERTSYLTNTCIKNHTPLTFKADQGEIKGNGYTLKNLCRVDSVLAEESRMVQPIGLFGSLKSVTVSNLKFNNAYFKAFKPNNGSAGPDAEWLFGVGALAGQAESSKFTEISLERVAVLGVIAGGLAGYSQNSTFKKITTVDSVYVSTSTAISSYNLGNFSGIDWRPRYSTYLGGIVGYGVNLNFTDVNITVNISPVPYFNDLAAIGGLAGINALSKDKKTFASDWVAVKKAAVHAIAMEKGGATGGFFGEVVPYGGTGESLDMYISESTFEGKISNGFVDSTYAGGFVGRNALASNKLKIVGGSSNIKVLGNNSSGYKLQGIGGFVGASIGYESSEAYLSITGSNAAGSISFSQDYGNSSYSQKYYAGGLVGYGYFATDENAIVNDSADVSITVSLKSSTADILAVGGLVGYAAVSGAEGSGMLVSNAAYTGRIYLDGSLGRVFAGGAVGRFYTGSRKDYIDFEYVRAKNDSLVNIGTKTTSTSSSGIVYAGGLCGECESVGEMKNSGVFGNITVGGTSASSSLYVGGLAGSILASNNVEFSMANNYYIGLQVATVSSMSKVVGYLAGAFSLTDESIDFGFKSNYHYGTDESNAFGRYSGKGGWESSASHVVRNGESGLDDNKNGTLPHTSIISADMADFLNGPWNGEEKVWLYDRAVNNGFPYQKVTARVLVNDVPADVEESSSSLEFASSSSVAESSSSSDEAESSSSSEEVESSSSEAESSSSSEEESSSSSEEPAESSSSEEIAESSSSVEQEESSSSAEEAESSSSEAESSSSAEEESSSSSDEPEESSSSAEMVVASSSSEVFEVSSSSAAVIVMQTGSWNMISFNLLQKKNYKLSKEDVLYWWDESNYIGDYWQYQAYRETDKVEGSRGYWLWNAEEIVVEEDRNSIPEDAEISWSVDSVYSGWNIVANPYGWTVDLSGVDLEDLEVWRRNATTGEFEHPDELKPYEGVWVKSRTAKALSFKAKPARKTLKKSLAKARFAESDGWTLRAVLSDDFGKQDSWNVMGTASQAVSEEEPPSNMGDHVSLSIVDGKRRLAKSLANESDEMSWTVDLKASSDRDGYLRLEGVGEVNALGKRVYVTVGNSVTEMTEGKSLKVSLKKSASTAVVTVTSGAKPVVAGKSITDLRGIRTADGLNVNFETGNELSGARAKVELVSVSGKVAATAEFTATAGFNSVSLKVPERGLYVIRVRVGSQSSTRNTIIQ